MPKRSLRQSMLARRRSLPAAEVKSASTLVQQAFIMTGAFAKARVVALYAPIHNEVNTVEVMQAALASTKIVLFPPLFVTEVWNSGELPILLFCGEALSTFLSLMRHVRFILPRKPTLS